jgi:transketolase
MSAKSEDRGNLLPANSTEGGHFARALLAAAERDERIVGLTADLAKYTDMVAFRERHADRFVNVGMAEQNLVAVAAGLEMAGYRPVATTFAVFLTRRAFDFVAMQVAVHGGNVKLVAGLPGVCTTFGPSHQGIDDLAHMRALPGMTVLDPCDPLEMGLATKAMLEMDGPVYMRQLFGKEPIVIDRDTTSFEIGRAQLMRTGTDVGIVASSIMVKHALDAAEELEREGIRAAVLRVSTLKPFDEEAVAELASSVQALVTAENHSVVGGLYSATAEALLRRGVAVPTRAIGLQDEFGSFGSLDYNLERHGLTAGHVATAARDLLLEHVG